MKHIMFQGAKLMVTDTTQGSFFRALTGDEAPSFIEWAREQPKGVTVKSVWHPIVQHELLSSGWGVEIDELLTYASNVKEN